MSGPSWTAQFKVFGEVSGSVDPCERGTRWSPRTRRMDPDHERLWLLIALAFLLTRRLARLSESFAGSRQVSAAKHGRGYATKFFINGWHTPTDSVIWSRDHKSLLMLPLPEEQSLGGHRVELQLHVAVPEASERASRPSDFVSTTGRSRISACRASNAILTVRSANTSKFRGVSLIEIRFSAGSGREEGDKSRASLRDRCAKRTSLVVRSWPRAIALPRRTRTAPLSIRSQPAAKSSRLSRPALPLAPAFAT